ncbi:hypothetical protein EAY64_05460 [Aquitalea palustris]|uniref:Uncharacterized protein n=1 Tax=Aquitalea palustris TaxID=2480983 RepID=A0A454JKW7_9NEIS|nr:hypothetical protein [Aquitalea palustris]RMD00044.1 hypothetical protein EAY64_05460 [Aquitalea palustris]
MFTLKIEALGEVALLAVVEGPDPVSDKEDGVAAVGCTYDDVQAVACYPVQATGAKGGSCHACHHNFVVDVVRLSHNNIVVNNKVVFVVSWHNKKRA